MENKKYYYCAHCGHDINRYRPFLSLSTDTFCSVQCLNDSIVFHITNDLKLKTSRIIKMNGFFFNYSIFNNTFTVFKSTTESYN